MEYSSFFNSENGDRKYLAEDWDRHLKDLIKNGIFGGGTNLQVTADGSAMSVVLQPGKAWINGKHYENDQALTFPVGSADGTLNRIDRIVIGLDYGARTITAQIKKGAFASNAAAPDLQRDADKYELCLASISIPAGTSEISQSLITDTRLDTDICGIVTGAVNQVDTTTLYKQIQTDLAEFKSGSEVNFNNWSTEQKESFQTWFDGIKGILGEDEAAKLLDLITFHKSDQTAHITTLACTKTGTVYALTGLTATSGIVSCVFKADAAYAAGDTFTVEGAAVTAQQQNGDSLDDECFKSGAVVPCIYDVDNKTLNFKSSGGAKLNLFVQPDEPTTKDGIWLRTAKKESIKKVVFDTNVWASGQWQNPSLASELPAQRTSGCCVAVGNYIYIFGGTNQTLSDPDDWMLSSALKYDTVNNTFSYITSMPRVMFSGCCVAVGNYIYIFGGQTGTSWNNDRYESAYAYRYNIESNTYTTLANLPTAIYQCVCAAVGNYIYIFGGYDKSVAYRYNIESGTYTTLLFLPTTSRGGATTFAYNGNVYLIGGRNSDSSTTWPTEVLRYNVQDNSYTVANSSVPHYFMDNTGTLMGTKVINYNEFSQCSIYDIEANTFTTVSCPFSSGNTPSGCAFVNDTVYLFGTKNTDTNKYTMVECFKLTAKQYSNSPTFIVYYVPSDTTYEASIVKSSKIDYLPTYFKNCMLFKDGNITFPALYVGNGTAWIKKREAA